MTLLGAMPAALGPGLEDPGGLAVAWRLVLSALLGGMIGAEREYHSQAAGIRTHAILAVGAALGMLLSLHMAVVAGEGRGDPGRIAAQVVSGIGFLGAGAILRLGASIRGLTTATSLWTVAGVGLACGAGYYLGAFVSAALVFAALHWLDQAEKTLGIGRDDHSVRIVARDRDGIADELRRALAAVGIVKRVSKLTVDRTGNRLDLEVVVRVPDSVPPDALARALGGVPDVQEIHVE
ncbi:MAG: MgtC/SapB family protein [Planctomycetales bacterium]|nr:MgtC/SapB family protein [Planctomycetales bacterium]